MIDERLQNADRELRTFLYYCQDMVRLYEQIREIDLKLNHYGVSSPVIRSAEEAKYQRGTPVYSIQPLLELFSSQDELFAEYRKESLFCRSIQRKLTELTPEETEYLYFRYEKRMTLRQMGDQYCSGKDMMCRKLEKILEILEKFI